MDARVGILTALFNAATLVIMAVFIGHVALSATCCAMEAHANEHDHTH